jgi:hypothetical protein
MVSQALASLTARAADLEAHARRPADVLLADHRRVRQAADARGTYAVRAAFAGRHRCRVRLVAEGFPEAMAVPRRTKQARLEFEAIAIEGGLLLPEWLARLRASKHRRRPRRTTGSLAGSLCEMRSLAFGASPRGIARSSWRLATSNPDRQATAVQFVTALLRECFQFTSLHAVPPKVVDEREFPIGHAALAGRVRS